ncbi:MAG TPA: hypothetical protein VL463_00085, partial [Kofleriaceae bacterium]|nr:hypothetical protein [Kofleriaceae bacterium]
MHALAPHVDRIRLAAEAALLRRLNAGAGFADARIAHQVFVRDPSAQARIARGTLRPSQTHAKQAIEVDELLAAATNLARGAQTRLALLGSRLGLDDDARAIVEIAIAYAIDADVRDLIHALAARRAPALYTDIAAELAQLD